MSQILKSLVTILDTVDDEIIENALYAWINLTEMEDVFAEEVIAEKFPKKKVLSFAERDDPKIALPALKCISNMCTGNQELVDKILDEDLIKVLTKVLIKSGDKSTLKEVCWALNNIATGPSRNLISLVKLNTHQLLCDFISKPIIDIDVLLVTYYFVS